MELSSLAIGLALLGLAQLLAGLCCTRTIIRELPARRRSWSVLAILILVFAVGYTAFAIYLGRGHATPFLTLIAGLFAAGGTFVFIVSCLSRDSIEEARRLSTLEDEHARITDAQRRLQTIFDNAAEGIVTFDGEGIIESCNRATEHLLGRASHQLVGQPVMRFVEHASEGSVRTLEPSRALHRRIEELAGQEFEMVARHADGRPFALSVRLSRIVIDGNELFTALISDIGERKDLLSRLQFLAERDTTTALYNRSYFQERLDRALARCDGEHPLSLIFIDLDNFKRVNDVFGHAAGDRLLVEIAELLQGHFPGNCVTARFGGDEFTTLVPDMDLGSVTALAEGLRAKLDRYRFRRGGQQVDVGCSIGISTLARTGGSGERLMAQADTACHLAKRAGRNRVRVFDADDRLAPAGPSRDVGWSRRIATAIESDRLALAGRPIVNVAHRTIDGHQILPRMLDDDDRLIMPDAFLPAAERLGLAGDIDRWVIDNAVDLLVERRRSTPAARFSINLSAQALDDDSVRELLARKLAEVDLDPDALTFGIAERVAIANMEKAERLLSGLRGIGCRTALDDFGSGLCSFGHLRELSVDVVKIDGRLVAAMVDDEVDASIVRSINEVAHAGGMTTVAESVGSRACLDALAAAGVDHAQGRHLGEPERFGGGARSAATRAA